MKLLGSFLPLTLFIVTVLAKSQRFDNYKVYEINVQNEDHVNVLRSLEEDAWDRYDFWNSPIIGRTTDIMVSPEKAKVFESMIKSLNMDLTVKISNLQEFAEKRMLLYNHQLD